MRVTVGAIAVLGLAASAVTFAAAQPPAQERGATFKPPQVIPPGELPIARGAADDLPSSPYLSTTPVQRSTTPARAAGGPAWLTGADPNVVPAMGFTPNSGTSNVRTLSPAATPTSQLTDASTVPSQPRLLDRLRGIGSGDKQPTPKALPQQVQPEQPTANTPFRGTGANGSPVYAGPPAYRWYGWGTVTPGANPLAPAGQYPKASANWYAITGATPGAFPVQVSNSNPARMPPGTEPPTYGLSRSQPGMQPVVPVAVEPRPEMQNQPQPAPSPQFIPPSLERPDPARTNPPTGYKFMPAPAPIFVPPATVPIITAPPIAKPTTVIPPTLPGPVTTGPPPIAPPVVPKPDPVSTLPPMPPVPTVVPVPTGEPKKAAVPVPTVPPAEPVKVPLPSVEPKPLEVSPSPLPTSVTENPREEHKWQPNTEQTPPPPGTWRPAPGTAPLPTQETNSWQTGSAQGKPVVARAQRTDNTPDPIATLIQRVCQGRAKDVEVRYTGTKKLQVCFEIRGAAEAQKLVGDISKRPELTAYQIDFCVLVK
jgi:hypothetical protein